MSTKVGKTQVLEAVAKKTGQSVKATRDTIDAFAELVGEELGHGNSVSILNFGVFQSRASKARKGRNPKTGETIEIAARNRVKFLPGKHLKDAVNEK